MKQSPLSAYLRPKDSESVRLAILMALRGGGNVKTSLQGISLFLQTNICMERLCFYNLSTTVDINTGRSCYSNLSLVSNIRAKGKVLKTIQLSDGDILTVPRAQIIEIDFPRESDLVLAHFEAKVHLFGVSQRSNVTLNKKQLSFEIQAEVFNKYMATLKVVSNIDQAPDWKFLRFIVQGRMTNSSLLLKSLRTKIMLFAKNLAEKAAKKVKNVERSLRRAKERFDLATTLVNEKQKRLNEASQTKQEKESNLHKINIAYGKAKAQLNSSLTQFLKLKNKKMCEFQNCSYIFTDTCIPTLCQKEIIVNYSVPNCQKRRKEMEVDVIVPYEEEEVEWVKTYQIKRHSTCGDTATTLRPIGNALIGGGAIISYVSRKAGAIVTGIGYAVRFIDSVADSMFDCDDYEEKIEGPLKEVKHKVRKNRIEIKTVQIEEFVCDSQPKIESVVSGYHPVECCKNEIHGKIKVLDPNCVSHNMHCSRNMTLLAEEIEFEKENLKLYEFQAMTSKGKQSTIAQLEVSKARAKFDFATNQLEIARALLQQHEHAKESINITTVRTRERLGLKIAEILKSLKGKTFISVDSLVFSVSMTKSSTKTRFPLTAYLRTPDGSDRTIEFSMDFAKEDHSLTLASRLIVEKLFGTSRSRRRRSAKEELVASERNDSGLPLGHYECLLSQEAHVFFTDVIGSLKFAIKSRKELEGTMAAGIRGLEVLPGEADNDGRFLPGPSQEIRAAFSDTVQSMKETYLDASRSLSWNTTLNDLRGFLDVLSRKNNFTECSGIRDCIDFFFDSLEEMYEMENHPRAIIIKSALKDLEKIIGKFLREDQTMSILEDMITQATSLINKSKDDAILCGKKPNIERNSPAEVVAITGATITLVCEATSTTEIEYLWLKNGKSLEDTNSTILELPNVTTESGGAYKCQVSNSRGSTMSNVTIVAVHQKPNITEQPLDVQVLVGEKIISLVCNSTGVPLPLTEWFFIPIKGKTGDIIRLNTTKPVLEIDNLTSESAGFYYCNVSNLHGAVQSRMARVDVLRFAPGVPTIALELKLKQCTDRAWPENSRLHYNSSKPYQHVDFAAFDYVTEKLFEYLSWPLGNIETKQFRPFPNASISVVVKGDNPSISENSTSKKLEALNSFSLSRRRMGNSLKKLHSALEDGSIKLRWKGHLAICGDKESFAVGFPPQKCPNGTRRHRNGFLCGK